LQCSTALALLRQGFFCWAAWLAGIWFAERPKYYRPKLSSEVIDRSYRPKLSTEVIVRSVIDRSVIMDTKLITVSASVSDAPWFALTTRPRHEKTVASGLELRSVEGFLPLYPCPRSWSDRVKVVDLPLFPGYVFCRFSYPERLRVLEIPGVTSVIGFNGQDAPIPETEIRAIQKLLACGYPVQPWQYLRMGECVRIVDGPLAGVQGILLSEKSGSRVVVSVEVLQRSIAVEIDRTILAALSHGAAPPPAFSGVPELRGQG
jgi:transcription termination/antitermination protein NusG